MILRDIAHARSGDKGDIANISVIAYDTEGFERLRTQLTVDRALRHHCLQQFRPSPSNGDESEALDSGFPTSRKTL